MPAFNLVKMSDGAIRGMTQDDDKAYKAHIRKREQLGAGEFFNVKITHPRDGKKFKKFWSLLRFLYAHWEPAEARQPLKYRGKLVEKNIEAFRETLIILAGYGEPTYEIGPRGGVRVRMRAKSIAYDAMEDDDFNTFYKALITVAIKHFLPRGYKTSDHVSEIIGEIERYDS